MGVKISSLEIENTKRVKAVKIEPSANGLTIIGGNNSQGKTSVLDSIAWSLGGDKFKPSQPQREGSMVPPSLHITLSNGLIVERKGKNSDLKVIDPEGRKAGQQLLNEFIEQLALNLPKFMEASDKEKADTLLKIIGIGDKLSTLERQEADLYNNRLAIGRIADQKKKFAKEMEIFEGVPKEPVSVSELIRQQQEILAHNGENQRKRTQAVFYQDALQLAVQKVDDLRLKLKKAEGELLQAQNDYSIAQKSVMDLQDESTAELEQNILNVEQINIKVRANLDKEKAEDDAKQYEAQYNTLTTEIEDVRKAKMELLRCANLPLAGLSVEDGHLTYNGFKWDNMSGSDQLKVSAAIVRKLNPECGFVLLDKLEQMDLDTLKEFGTWLEAEGLQAIATRVSTGDECSIIIEDGYVAGAVTEEISTTPAWKAGEF